MDSSEINFNIARAMGFEIIMVDYVISGRPFIPYPHVCDPNARKSESGTTSTSLVGGSWQKGRIENGEIISFFGRPCPDWAGNVAEALNLFYKFPNPLIKKSQDGGFTVWATDGIDSYSDDSLSVAICLTWLGWMKGINS